MDEEFKRPSPVNPSNNLLSVPSQSYHPLTKKERSAKSHIEFMKIMESNKDPLHRGPNPLQTYTIQEVSLHNKPEDAWIILNDKVYDMTMYINYHPGGKIIMNCAGGDGTALFLMYHPWVNINSIIGKLQIGTIIRYVD